MCAEYVRIHVNIVRSCWAYIKLHFYTFLGQHIAFEELKWAYEAHYNIETNANYNDFYSVSLILRNFSLFPVNINT